MDGGGVCVIMLIYSKAQQLVAPLVGKLEIFFATLRSKRISDFDVRWGNSGHSLGSLLTNLMILETMLSSDFFSDLSLLSYKSVA